MIRTKIVCTIGPASRELELLKSMIVAGMSVARLNFSHGDHDYHKGTIELLRQASEEVGQPVAILADLQGPKMRVGQMSDDGIMINQGETILLSMDPITGHRIEDEDSPHKAIVPVQYRMLPRDVRPGEHILLDDGLLELEVVSTSSAQVVAQVVIGGMLKSKKGLNLPNTRLSIPSITEKDWNDLDFALKQKVDWVALSFVRVAEDVIRLKNYIGDNYTSDRPPQVISKIEKPEALEVIDEIIDASDGIMVARGDLGIEIPPEKVPAVQKALIQRCNKAGKPVITATQMLDSMIRNPRPTRAEASDVANAILDGTDAIMLSGETASGKFPLESVQTMASIAAEMERTLVFRTDNEDWGPPPHVNIHANNVTDAVSFSTCETAYSLGAAAIITATSSGRTAKSVARFRPDTPIIAVTPNGTTQRQLMLTWGVIPLLSEVVGEVQTIVQDGVRIAAEAGHVKNGDRVIITAGIANNMPGQTNLMMVELVQKAGQVDFIAVTGKTT
jgi:pyruvate kinase